MTILLVEDNSDDVMLMRRSIRPAQQRFAQEGRQLHLVTVGTADEAESWLARNDPPACIVLDLGLPKKDGRQFLRELRLSEEWNTIPVVVATISDAFRERESAVNADAFWTKPVDLSRVVAAVDEGRLGCAAR
jgi:CheY-like chemotaxis protein